MDDLAILGVGPADRRKLESMGFTTLEQIALMTSSQLAMGKQKGDTLVERARTILANKNIEDIEVSPDEITVSLLNINDPVLVSIKDILEIREGDEYLDIDRIEKGIRISPKKYATKGMLSEEAQKQIEEKTHLADTTYRRVKEAANRHVTILNAKKKNVFQKFGIDLDRQKIMDFAEARGFNGFWNNVFEEIQGNDVVKKSITIAMFSSYDEPIHVLVIGDPGSSKSLAKDIIASGFKNISLIGGNSTRSGLVCNLNTGALGILPYSDKKLVLVDEFDKIPKEDIEYCSELLSNGKCSVHSAKVHKNIESNFIMIAFANPKSKIFGETPINDIGISPVLMSRFGLVIKTENLEKDERMALFKNKFLGKTELKKMPELYDQWVKLARLHQPKMSVSDEKIKKYLEDADKIFQKHSNTPLRRDLRMGDYIKRIPMAIARAEFSNVTDEILEKAEKILMESLKIWDA
ncbi:MAG: hypothetical protein HWN65_21395 [Candidatus Helarchaeota archaeon]|nr:hypothetical protein [Candidatus Helarchaeota archaeon]